MPRKSSNGVLMLPARALLQPLAAKLAVNRREPGATTEHEIELGLAGLGHPRKTQQTGLRGWIGAKEMLSSATLIASKLLPDPHLSEASALHYYGWRWQWMPPAPHWAKALSWVLPLSLGNWWKGRERFVVKTVSSLSNCKLAPVEDLMATSRRLFTFFPW